MRYGVLLGCAALAASAMAQNERGLAFGPEVGAYFPTDRTTKDLMGNTWLNFGFGPTRAEVREGLSLSTDLKFLSRKSRGNKVFIMMPTVGVSKAFNRIEDEWVPYVAVRVGPAYMDYSVTRGANYRSVKRVGWTTALEAGVVFDGRLRIQGTYHYVSKHDGLNFSGFGVSATFELFRW